MQIAIPANDFNLFSYKIAMLGGGFVLKKEKKLL